MTAGYGQKKHWARLVLAMLPLLLTLPTQANPTLTASQPLNQNPPISENTHAAMPPVKRLSQPLPTDTLPEGFADKLKQAGLAPDAISVVITRLDNANQTHKPPLVNYRAAVPRTPASTQKLIPTFIALDSLGKDFVWQTELWTRGLVVGDTLHGDVLIKGSGSPRLDDDQLTALFSTLAQQGVKHIDGMVWIDNRIFRGVQFDPYRFDGQGMRPYNASPNGLLINFGTLSVHLSPETTNQITSQTANPTADQTADQTTVMPTSNLLTAVPSTVIHHLEQQTAHQAYLNQKQQLNQKQPLGIPTISTIATAATNDESTSTATDDEPLKDHIEGKPKTASLPKQFRLSITPKLADFDAPSQLAALPAPCRGMADERLFRLTNEQLTSLATPQAGCGEQDYWLTFPDSDAMLYKAIKAHVKRQFASVGAVAFLPFEAAFFEQKKPFYALNSAKPSFFEGIPKLVAVAKSAPLAEQISDINHYSNNVMTEQLALSLPVYAGHQADSDYQRTFAFIQRWWQTKLPHVTAPVMSRASGLCRDCTVTPQGLLGILTLAYQHPDFASYQASLPLAGVSGTMKALKQRQPNNPAIGRAWIKTGTLDNVISMAGYVYPTQSGERGQQQPPCYAVVAIINAPNVKNNAKARAVLDDLLAWTVGQ